MGIAAGLIWIAIGIGYIIFRGLREETANTLTVLIVVAGVIAVGAVLGLITEWLNTLSPIGGGIFQLCLIVGLYTWYLIWLRRTKKKDEAERLERERQWELKSLYRKKAKEILTEEDYEAYAREHAKELHIGFDQRRLLTYWKEKENYERVVNACSFERGLQMMKEELGQEK